MKPELDKALCEKYPEIFANRHADMRATAMCWGFECGDGWFNIIDRLCHLIQHHINNREDQLKIVDNWKAEGKELLPWMRELAEIPQVVAVQVKEKFGGLRFYVNGSEEYIDGAIAMAEEMSYVTCEICGKPGHLSGNSWRVTRCSEHHE